MAFGHKPFILPVIPIMKKLLTSVVIFAVLSTGSLFAKKEKAPEKPSNVTVNFEDSDDFTDARSDFGFGTDEGYLDIISRHLKATAGRLLAEGQKLEITVTDVDLAGEFLPTSRPEQIRVIKEIFRPRITLNFKLTNAAGAVVKEGDRTLTDLNFMNNLGVIGRNEPLYYDKTMLSDWVNKEFKEPKR